MTRIACCQFAPQFGEVGNNISRMTTVITAAARDGAQIVVLPELANSGYMFSGSKEAIQLAEAPSGPTVSTWRALSSDLGIVIVGGFCEVGENERVFNSAAIVVGNAEPAIYRKVHLWEAERLIFTPGDRRPPVVDTPLGRVSTMVCYDLEFPEWVRKPVLEGADIICAPVNWPRGPRPPSERPTEIVRTQANASVNRIAIAICDRTGTERGVDWVSGSVIVDADGWPIAMANPEEPSETTISGDVRIIESREKKIGRFSDVIADRRPDLYLGE